MENIGLMQTLEIEEITFTDNSNSRDYCEAVNKKVKEGWVLFGPRELESGGWIKQYYVKIKKSNNKTTVKE